MNSSQTGLEAEEETELEERQRLRTEQAADGNGAGGGDKPTRERGQEKYRERIDAGRGFMMIQRQGTGYWNRRSLPLASIFNV